MDPSSKLSESSELFKWVAANGKVYEDGYFSDQQGKLQIISSIFAHANAQIFELVKTSSIDNIDTDFQALDELISNTIVLKRLYEKKVGFLFSKIFNPKAKTLLNSSDKLVKDAQDTQLLLQAIKRYEKGAMPLEGLDKAFHDFIGNNWERRISILNLLSDGSRSFASLRQPFVSWTTNRIITWVTNPSSKNTPLDGDLRCRLLPHIDFSAFTGPQLVAFDKCYFNDGNYKRYWSILSDAHTNIATAMEARGVDFDKVQYHSLSGRLMKLKEEMDFVQNVQHAMRVNFPGHLLTRCRILDLMVLLDGGVLTGETPLPGFNLENDLSLALREPIGLLSQSENHALKAAAFILRLHRKYPLRDKSIVYRSFRCLKEYPQVEGVTHLNQNRMIPQQFYFLYSLFEWIEKVGPESYREFEMLYPSYALLFQQLKGPKEGWSSDIHSAMDFVHQQRALSSLERSRLVRACVIDIGFPHVPNKIDIEEVKELSEKALELLLNKYPYVHGFIKLSKIGLRKDWNYKLQGPTDLMLAMRMPLQPNLIKTNYTFSELGLLDACLKGLNKTMTPPSLRRWFSCTVITDRRYIDLSGQAEIDDEQFEKIGLPEDCESIYLSDTAVSATYVQNFQALHPKVRIDYRDSLNPGRKLLSMERGQFQQALNSLISEVASVSPILDDQEREPFLEYCCTHLIAEASDEVLTSFVVKAKENGWMGIGEYCLAKLIGSVDVKNVLNRWRLSKEHPQLDPLRHHCARFSMAYCLPEGIFAKQLSEHEQEAILEVAKEITLFPHDEFAPPEFQPVDLGKHLTPDSILICEGDEEVDVNLLFLSLHSRFFELMLRGESYSLRPIKAANANPEEGIDMEEFSVQRPENVKALPMISGAHLNLIYAFLRENKLPEGLTKDELAELIRNAQLLEIPSLVIAATELHRR